MALSWNEIKDRALQFTKEWAGETKERAEKDSFWNDFFNVFGISRRRIATFEEPVKKLSGNQGFIDLFWKGTLLVEHKSKGKDLNKAYEQATDYFPGLKEHELPKYILVSDFERIKLFDLDERTEHEFQIKDFYKNVKLFGFIAGYQKRSFKEEDPVNIQAAELMGKLHDQLKGFGYEGHPLEVYLVRLLFVLFADDTGIFEKDIFKEFIEQKTNKDGSNLGALIAQFFQILNTPKDKRLRNLDEHLAQFPYINGKLFEEFLPIAAFNSHMRDILLEASALDWGKISPAIFGSLFQSVMNPEQRRNLGAHYTSEKNILKLIKPLFLDDLRAEFEKIKSNSKKLQEFHKKLSTLKFLDPACGSGNFLIISYRELRLLEIDILRELYRKDQTFLSIEDIIWIDVDQFYGIEIDEFPARIAEVAMWLIDHQMNMLVSEEFGQYFARLPLKKAAKIVHGNALRMDWNSIIEGGSLDITATETNIIQVNEPIAHYDSINIYTKGVNIKKGSMPLEDKKWNTRNRGKVDYILGNPPFVGKKEQSSDQKEDMNIIFDDMKGSGVLDYVTNWYVKAADYINKSNTKVAFVSTNSISQGEQTGILWNYLYKFNIKIHFAHRMFKWNNEAKGNAKVYVIIIGFAQTDTNEKLIYDYSDHADDINEKRVNNINPYLVQGSDVSILPRSKPICNKPNIVFGSMPNDGGHLLLSEEEKNEYIKLEPEGSKYLRDFTGGAEFIKNIKRYCFWLVDSNLEMNKLPILRSKILSVKKYRLASKRETTRKLANYPTLFGEIRQPTSGYIIIPNLSSGLRKYIPIGFKDCSVIASNLALIIPNASIYHFGVLTSSFHMTWVRYTCGMLGTSLRYSNKVVYNNFPWPKEPSEKNKKKVEEKAHKVLDVRAEFPDSSLADLYDPLTMPPKLVKAHQELDKAVDLCYRPQPFVSETARIEYLFELYNEYTQPLMKVGKRK
ncbi:MAG: class I SAM-dependent DNA methyltransferase [Candidatus Delongbacteria bacterium]|jgi:type I restriction-modification system DNA methylase subunit|nr:class I SAM-dependent DNA methyltransferase [Candidatus Delongbacteria bacterium]